MVAHAKGIGQRLGEQGVLAHAGHARKIGDGSQGQHQIVEAQRFASVLIAQINCDLAVFQINLFDCARIEGDAGGNATDGHQDMLGFDGARDEFWQHGMEDKEVVLADDADVDVAAALHQLLQFHRTVCSGKATAKDEHFFLRRTNQPKCGIPDGNQIAGQQWGASFNAPPVDKGAVG